MDVSLWARRFVCFLIPLTIVACGNRFDLAKERGRKSAIEQANFYLSNGECENARTAIDPLYSSSQVTDEVRIIMASTYACQGGFKLLSFMSNIAGASNFFSGMVKSLSSSAGDGTPTKYYSAVDVMTGSGARLSAAQRTTRENTFMVFLQMGVIASILRNYGSPDTSGNQTAALVYNTAMNPAGEMANEDACALTAAVGILVDSYVSSSLSDSDSGAVYGSLNSVCVAAGLASCNVLNKDRSLCDGTNANSVVAAAVVSGVDAGW